MIEKSINPKVIHPSMKYKNIEKITFRYTELHRVKISDLCGSSVILSGSLSKFLN